MAKRDPLKTTGKARGGIANLIPFKKGTSGNPGGRAKKTVTWKEAEAALREAVPRLLLLTTAELTALWRSPEATGAEKLAMTYIREHAVEAVNRFLGKVTDSFKGELTGKDGAPLHAAAAPLIDFSKFTPEAIRALIEATK